MKRAILLDRSWAARLALQYEALPVALHGRLAQADLVAMESGGASALEAELGSKEALRNKLYRVRRDDLPRLDAPAQARLNALIDQLAAASAVQHALLRYRAATGRMSEDDRSAIGYAVRLLLLAGKLDADLLVWPHRYGLMRALLDAAQVTYTERVADGLMQSASEATRFPLADDGAAPLRVVRIETLALATDAAAADGITAASAPTAAPASLLQTQSQLQPRWHAFISHASEDKQVFVRPLADALRQRGQRIWYDDFTLKVGDSLRGSIDHGLANSRFGIVVLSESFFAKVWPQQELDGLSARESAGTRVILPVWHGVDEAVVRRHSPMLAGRLAANSSQGVAAVADALLAAMQV